MILGLIVFIHVVISLFLIAVVLLQQGKGADLSVFGGGGTMTAFGAQGAATLLHKLTVISFVLFIVTTMLIGIMQTDAAATSVMSGVPTGDDAAPVAAATEEAVDEVADDVDEAATAVATDVEAAAEATGDAVEAAVDDDGAADEANDGEDEPVDPPPGS